MNSTGVSCGKWSGFSATSSTSSLEQAAWARLLAQLREPEELARRSLLSFTRWTFPQYQAELAHAVIAAALDRVVQGKVKRLMIVAPPQHGKSELASVRFPAFWLGKRPDEPVILASYGASLAEDKSRQVRDTVESDAFQQLFPSIRTRRDSRSVQRWRLAGRRGGLVAVGVGGPITGHGAMLGIVDDPFENWETAQSPTMREKVWDWWRGTFRTRVWEDGAIVLIMTRWHEEDLVGRLLAHSPGEWTVLRLPAAAETEEERRRNNEAFGLPADQPDPLGRAPGEALAPRRFSQAALAALRKDVQEMVWQAEYQGAPRPLEGLRFQRAWFQYGPPGPKSARRVRYWDKAGSQDAGAWTAGVLMAVHEGRYIVEDVVRGQWSAREREEVMRQTAIGDAERFGRLEWLDSGANLRVHEAGVETWIEQEPGSGGKESAEATVANLAGFVVHVERVTGSKDVRMEPFRAQLQGGNVQLVVGNWNTVFVDELCAVPHGRWRDQADAAGGAFNKLAGFGVKRKRKAGAAGGRR